MSAYEVTVTFNVQADNEDSAEEFVYDAVRAGGVIDNRSFYVDDIREV